MAVSLSISITQNSQSIPNNTSNVTVAVSAAWTGGSYNKTARSGYVVIDGTKYTFTSTFNTGQSTSGSQVIHTRTVTIPHKADGTKTLVCSASYSTGVSSGTITKSATKELSTIARKSTLSVANGVLNTAQTLTVTRQSTSFTHTITATSGASTSTICTKSSTTSFSFTPPQSWANNNPTGLSVPVVYKIETFSGSTSIGSVSYTRTCSIPDKVAPTITVINLTDPSGFATRFNGYVQNYSSLNVNIEAVGSYGSTIVAYKTVIDGKTYAGKSFTSNVLTNSGDITVSVIVTDSRGRTGTLDQNITVQAYSPPKIASLKATRDDPSIVMVTFSASATNLPNNTVKYVLSHKMSRASNYQTTELIDYANNFSVTNGWDAFDAGENLNYDIKLEVSDSITKTVSYCASNVYSTVMSIRNEGRGIAFGKVASRDDTFEVEYEARFNQNVQMRSDLNVLGRIYDAQETEVRNGLAYYGGSGSGAVDPNTTSEHLILTSHGNCPVSNTFFYIHTLFYQTKNSDANRAQYAIPYSSEGSMYHRYYYNGGWSDWRRHINEDEGVITSLEGIGGLQIDYGQGRISYDPNDYSEVEIEFSGVFENAPYVVVQQVFDEVNLVVQSGDISETGFVVKVPPVGNSSGSRRFDWIAIGFKVG